MKKKLYWISSLLLLMSCQQGEMPTVPAEECVLEFGEVRTQHAPTAPSTKVDNDLAVTITDASGVVKCQYPAGSVPSKIVLYPGVFTIKAFTENGKTWMTANNGLGAPYYYGEQEATLTTDQIKRVQMTVPMVNYGVELRLPERFDELFTKHTFTITSGARELNIQNGQKAYFAVSAEGFTYKLSVTNNDGVTHTSMPAVVKTVENGKLYSVNYSYDYGSAALQTEVHVSDETGKK